MIITANYTNVRSRKRRISNRKEFFHYIGISVTQVFLVSLLLLNLDTGNMSEKKKITTLASCLSSKNFRMYRVNFFWCVTLANVFILSSSSPCLIQDMLFKQRVKKFLSILDLQILHVLRLYSRIFFFFIKGFLSIIGIRNCIQKVPT